MILKHYYHVYVDGKYIDILVSHVEALIHGHLINRLHTLHFGLVGSAENQIKAQNLLAEIVPRQYTVSHSLNGWEQATQKYLYADAVDSYEPFLALYAHTKGASDRSPINEVWRKAMTRTCVYQWMKAVAILESTDAVAAGPLWAPFNNGLDLGITEGTQYFAGTFWWAKSEAIAAIGPPETESRFGAEAWIGKVVTELGLPIRNLLNVKLEIDSLRPFGF